MTDWADVENVRREWPAEDLDPDADLAAWRDGNQVYEANEDYGSMMKAGALMARALRHSLYGDGLFAKADHMQTTHRVLFSSAFPPPDGRTLLPEAAAQLRLALTIVKKEGWQSREHGGDGAMSEFLQACWPILGCAVAPAPERPWEGDLKRFFGTHPFQASEMAGAAEATTQDDVESRKFGETVEYIHRATTGAGSGDPASEARAKGTTAALTGQPEAALAHFEEAARLGDVDSMYDAGAAACELGRWEEGLQWFARAAEGGRSDGYAALTQLAADRGDKGEEYKWARLGAEASQSFCMYRYGQLLMQSDPGNEALLRGEAIPLLKAAAEAEEEAAHFLVGIAYGQLNDRSNARLWLLRAEERGDKEATRVLDEHGLR